LAAEQTMEESVEGRIFFAGQKAAEVEGYIAV